MTKSDIRGIIGKNIRAERLAKKMSIEELSVMLDFTSGHVGLIERGERGTSPDTLYKLSKIFDISIDSLFRKDFETSPSFDEDILNIRRKKISCLTYGLGQFHLDSIIRVITDVRILINSNSKDKPAEELDE